ncbi:DNA-directed RNA polymerases I and III subunit RPAC1 [Neodiprion lecontei]|uniref:DNA-directed RNA polymerases I and III subunit RPAC1 n=1 Tax=Neodiprion lecontei TaxID=441921 RepID=A0A6J0C0E8_NEOLC|nr:DNA-directed RNA polymerases I and III subunit RPAC1 [Neodiprion lecontei]
MQKGDSSRIILEEYAISNAVEHSIVQEGEPWSIEKFAENLKVEIIREGDNGRELEFDLIGCAPALANAFRRILLSEVPSMAIEKVFIRNNTSLIQDEVLAHRLGLLPLRADPRLFEYPALPVSEDEDASDQDTLRYELKVTCSLNPHPRKDSRRPEDIYINDNVYSRDVKWVPLGQQAEIYPKGEEQLGVLESDILICKMRPGQEIHAFMHAVKGIGKDHAKFSPVATATYRMLPEIKLTKPVKGEMAERLKGCFSPGVIEIVRDKKNGPDDREARVKNARYDSCSRNVFRHNDLKECVQLTRVPDHFIFTIESLGALPPAVLFLEAVKTLKAKCRTFIEEIDNIA